MATQTTGNPFYLGNDLNGDVSPLLIGDPKRSWLVEAASQSYGVGELVYLASGKVTICVVDGSTKVMTSAIAGVARKAATGTTNAQARIQAIRQDDLWAMNVYHATAASAVTALTQLGSVYGIVKPAATGKWHVDIENAVEGGADSNARVKVVGFLEKNPYDGGNFDLVAVGDIYGIAIVKFLPWSAASDFVPMQRLLQLA